MTTDRLAELADDVVRVCRRLDDRGLIAGLDGNVSVRIDEARILVTPAGMPKGRCRAQDLVVVSLDGRRPSGSAAAAPSTELRMHLRIYARRADVRAIVHAHPPVATAFGVAGEGLVAPVLPEIILQLGSVPLVPYAPPGTEALADGLEPYVMQHDAFLLANHGATTTGSTLDEALQRMESVEHAARIVLAARQLGQVRTLASSEAAALDAVRRARRGAQPLHEGDTGADYQGNR